MKSFRSQINKFARVKQYFLRGHTTWFSLPFSLLNFTLIFYNLLLKNLDFVPDIFKQYTVFFICFLLVYLPSSAIIGYIDFKKGTFNAEVAMFMDLNPIWKKVFENQTEILKRLKELEK